MIEITTDRIETNLLPRECVARWADPETWSQWDKEVNWARLDSPVAVGATGRLKPVGGPALVFEVVAYDPESEFTNVGRLPGARIRFEHRAFARSAGSLLEVSVTITGPLARLWARMLSGGFRQSTQRGLKSLVDYLDERANAASAGK